MTVFESWGLGYYRALSSSPFSSNMFNSDALNGSVLGKAYFASAYNRCFIIKGTIWKYNSILDTFLPLWTSAKRHYHTPWSLGAIAVQRERIFLKFSMVIFWRRGSNLQVDCYSSQIEPWGYSIWSPSCDVLHISNDMADSMVTFKTIPAKSSWSSGACGSHIP